MKLFSKKMHGIISKKDLCEYILDRNDLSKVRGGTDGNGDSGGIVLK